jgi:endonuclease/exonuclease/phosphatase family metal-dependent hydrolase
MDRPRPLRRRALTALLSIALALASVPLAAAPAVAVDAISLTAIGATYTQNFNTLATSGTTNTALPDGWAIHESGTSTRVNGQYAADNGFSGTGDTYSYGATGSSERALGDLLSGTITPTFGVSFRNDTGTAFTKLAISYTGEQWRLGTANRGPDRIDLQYSLSATSLATGTWVDVDALDFSSPVTTGTVGLRDGNASADRAAVAGTVVVTIPAAATIWIRWTDFNASGADDGLAVDDLSVTPFDDDAAPTVASTSPANAASNVARDANVEITFSENVTVSGGWYDISCATSGPHTATVSGGPMTFSLDPDADFGFSETCTVTVYASQVTDQDANDPPDNMAADQTWSFTTVAPPTPVRDVQGAGHISPKKDQNVSDVRGIVTVKRPSSIYIQDPDPDSDDATSEAVLVFGGAATAAAQVGDLVSVSGRVIEFRPGGASSTNLTTTEITTPGLVVTILSSGNPLPAPTVIGIGAGGRMPPTMVIEDDATGDVETSGVFDPASDGIDFYESLEAMLVQVNDAVAVSTRVAFGAFAREIAVVGDGSTGAAGLRTPRGGIVVRPGDFNPERILLSNAIAALPAVNIGDVLGDVVGVIDYSFGNFKLLVTATPSATPGGIAREITATPSDHEIAVATFNVENLDPGDGPAKFDSLAHLIVDNLRSPDLLALEEVQDDNGPVNDSTTSANVTLSTLVAAIQAAGGPTYEYRQIDPVDDTNGGEPGGNIRVAFLFRTDRGLSFVDRPGGGPTTATTAVSTPSGPQLSASPGLIDPTSEAFDNSRKPLVAEFRMRGKAVFVVANHFNSKSGDQPLFGRFQPPSRPSEVQRGQQAAKVGGFVDEIIALDANANVIVLGDLNDFGFSDALGTLEASGLTNLADALPEGERYSFIFDGNSQALDHILVSDNLRDSFGIEYDIVHVNAEFADGASDHDPQVARLDLRGRPAPKE